jgi:hypothetical protein
MFAVGVVYGKLLKCGYWQIFHHCIMIFWYLVIAPTITSLVQLQIPPVLGRALNLIHGILVGLGAKVDQNTIMFAPPQE